MDRITAWARRCMRQRSQHSAILALRPPMEMADDSDQRRCYWTPRCSYHHRCCRCRSITCSSSFRCVTTRQIAIVE